MEHRSYSYETLSTLKRSLRFFHRLQKKRLLILFLSCLAVCGHHLSPRIAIIFSLPLDVPKSLHVTSVYFPHLVLWHVPFPHSPTMWVLLPSALPQGKLCGLPSSSTRLLVYQVPLSSFWQVHVPYTKTHFHVFACPLGRASAIFISIFWGGRGCVGGLIIRHGRAL